MYRVRPPLAGRVEVKGGLARLLTELAAPWTVNVASCLILGWSVGHPGWGAFVALFSGLLPMLLIGRGVVRESIGNHHVTEHSERHGLLLAILGMIFFALVVQLVAGSPPEMIALTCAGLATLVGIALWTSIVRINASVHMAVWCGVVAILAIALGPWWWLGLALAPAIAWSRLHLDHHTVGQISVGAATGLIVAPSIYLLVA
ncbi:hypothetical protein [Rhodococcus sp. NPDC049939]|uniref:hypothetical protein n=1 Tax=Rhodococcus sp. NPDC049939 TaxID=3155511 RepID=UPI0033F3D5FB